MEFNIKEGKATSADYKRLPEGAPFELINGMLVQEPAPTYNHQDIIAAIATRLRILAEENNLGKILFSPIDVYFDDENVFQPDIIFVAKQNFFRIEKDGIHGAPDIVIEVLSPSNSYSDFSVKFHLYEKFGVSEYFIVDPESKDVIRYNLISGKFREDSREVGFLRSEILNFEFRF